MRTPSLASKREWKPSPFSPDWERSGLYNDKPKRPVGEGKYTTIVRHVGPGSVPLKPFDFEWEIFLFTGDVEVDGTKMLPGDHIVVEAGQAVSVRTVSGCQYLVIAR